MIALTLGRIAAIVDGEVLAQHAGVEVSAPAFVDSRAAVPGGLFVAVEGERADGHDFAVEAIAAGAAAALVRRPVDAPHVLVADPVVAVGLLATHVRSTLTDAAVVGITGSQGKTSAKDLLAQILEAVGPTVAPVGSLNNEIGVPLTLLRATAETRFLVVEMGARGRGHIAYLAAMAKPSVGVVLNVGLAHIGEFGGRDEIAVAKGELIEALPADGTAVLNRDDPLVDAMRDRTEARVLTFGHAADADVRLLESRLDDDGHVAFSLAVEGERHDIALPLVGAHQAVNAAAATAAALACGLAVDTAARALSGARARSRWRMETSQSPAGVTVVNDAYNANPDSMRAALETLVALGARRGGRTIAVLGEMRELGESSVGEHEAVGRTAAALGVDLLVVVGAAARPIQDGADGASGWTGDSLWVADGDAATAAVDRVARRADVVLVKASRAVGLESVGEALARTREAGG